MTNFLSFFTSAFNKKWKAYFPTFTTAILPCTFVPLCFLLFLDRRFVRKSFSTVGSWIAKLEIRDSNFQNQISLPFPLFRSRISFGGNEFLAFDLVRCASRPFICCHHLTWRGFIHSYSIAKLKTGIFQLFCISNLEMVIWNTCRISLAFIKFIW